jgi:hypothetical protein
MNKEEIQAKLHNYEERLKDVAGEIERLREQLAEAEKPKLRHGDFGINKANNARIVLFQFGDSNSGKRDDFGPIGIHSNTDIEPFGNIFDLLKEWSEDLEEFEGAGDCQVLNGQITSNNKDIWLKISSGSTVFTLEQAEKIWHKLGQMIATLKRKQNKTELRKETK